MIQLSNRDELMIHKAQRSARMAEMYKGEQESAKTISKSEFEENYPRDRYEIFTLDSLHSFRQKLNETDSTNADEFFKAECRGLQQFIVYGEHGPKLIFIREREG